GHAVQAGSGSTGRDGRLVEEADAVTEGIGGVETPLAPRLDRDRSVDAAARVADPLECRFQIVHGHVELPVGLALIGVVEIAVGGGIVAGQLNPAKRVMAPSRRYAPARSPQRVVVEADSSLDVRDTDQNSVQASAHGSSPSFHHGLTHAA